MDKLYERAEIYDLIESEQHSESIRRGGQRFWRRGPSGPFST